MNKETRINEENNSGAEAAESVVEEKTMKPFSGRSRQKRTSDHDHARRRSD
jgi:hypothetical protein